MAVDTTKKSYITQKAENDALRRAEDGNPELSKLLSETIQSLPMFVTMLDEAKRKKKARAGNGKSNGNDKQLQGDAANQLAKEASKS